MEQSPSWESNKFSASQKFPRILWNTNDLYLIHTSPPTVPILSQLDLVHTPTLQFLKIRLNIILPSSSGSLSNRFPHQNPVYASPLPHTRYMPRLPLSSRFHHPKNIGRGIQIIKFFIMYFSPLPCHLVHLRPKYSPQLPILKHPQNIFDKTLLNTTWLRQKWW
jgi:hypothetical protein